MSNEIHPTAIISSKAELGDNISIGPYTVVEGDVVIGSGTQLGPHVYCADGARIGKECRIHKGAVVATLPQDLKFKNEKTTFEIGDATTIREFCTLNRGTAEHMKSTVGSNCLLMAYAHVAHDCTIGDNVIIANSVQMGGHVNDRGVGDCRRADGDSPVRFYRTARNDWRALSRSQRRAPVHPRRRSAADVRRAEHRRTAAPWFFPRGTRRFNAGLPDSLFF